MKEKTYCGFISYCHEKRDTAVAKALQSSLENYWIPRAILKDINEITKQKPNKKLGAFFRDNTELRVGKDLSNILEQALIKSDWLIVVCSSKTPDNDWIKLEIELFLKYHDRERILTVLAEEPWENCIPEQLLSESLPDGKSKNTTPFSANACSTGTVTMRYKLIKEKLRLIATILGVELSALSDRTRKRRNKVFSVFATVGVLIAAAFVILTINRSNIISQMNEEIVRANDELNLTNEELANTNTMLDRTNHELADQRDIADQNAQEAIKQAGIAQENEARAVVGEAEAKRQTDIALTNEKLAKENEALALRNEAEAQVQTKIAIRNEEIARENESRAVKNEIQLLIRRSLADSGSNNNFEATRKALDAYARYTDLYPSGNQETKEQISQALSAAVYSQPYQLVQNIHNENRLMGEMRFSPDDRYILCVSGGGTTLVDASDGSILAIKTHAGMVSAIQFSPTGKYYLTVEKETKRIGIYETAAPARETASYVVNADLRDAVFISEESVLISIEGALLVWDFEGDVVREISGKELFQGTLFTTEAVVSPDGSIAVCSLDFSNSSLPVIDIKSGKRLEYQLPELSGSSVFAFSADSSRLACVLGKAILIWDTRTREIVQTIEIGNANIDQLAFSPDGKMLAAMSYGNVMLFLTKTGSLLFTFGEFDLQSIKFSAVFSPNSKELVVYGYSAQAYDLITGKLIKEFGGQMVNTATISHNGKYIALASTTGSAGIYSTAASATALPVAHTEIFVYPRWSATSLRSGMLEAKHVYDKSVYPGQFVMTESPSGQYTALSYPDGFVEVWDSSRGNSQSSYLIHEHLGLIQQTKITEQYLITAGSDGRIMVFDLSKGAIEYFIYTNSRVTSFEVCRDGEMIIALTETRTQAQVYDLSSGNRIYTLEAEAGDTIKDIGFTLDGTAAVIIQESGRTISGILFRNFDLLLDRAKSLPA